MISIKLNPADVEGVNQMLLKLTAAETRKAMVRTINRTMTGVRTDGTKILYDHYALTATVIRDSWKIRKALFQNPSGVVSTQGTFIRLINFGALQKPTGVSVKVLRSNPRATIAHAFIGKNRSDQKTAQVYWRKWKDFRKRPVSGRAYAKMPFEYRFPLEALYGPRIQDYLADPGNISTLTGLTGDRLIKNMTHEVDYLLGLRADNLGEEP